MVHAPARALHLLDREYQLKSSHSQLPFLVKRRFASNRPPSQQPPNPFAFAAIAVVAFGAFVFIVRKRDSDPAKDTREQRIPHPNPLIPPRSQAVS